MFNKLKLKLITINMVLLSTVFISIFSVIFFMTSNNINREISRNLDALVRNNKIPIPYSINIVVDLSSNKSINNIFKSYGAITSNNDIQEAVDKVVNSKKIR